MFAANAAGISVFATGGIGGVHRGAGGDVSADLPELARTPVAVVSSGAKSILDLSRTLEWLETAGVPLIGWKTDTFPAFFSRESEHELDVHVQKAEQAAALVRRHWNMGLTSGVLLCVPCPAEAAIDRKLVESALDQAEREAQARQVTGKSLTPFLLTRLVDLTGGATLQANLALLRNNASVAAQLAVALSGLDHSG
jgi:pseudouridine-5'-phosphate glycosidase